MIQVYIDNTLIYDSRIDSTRVLGLTVTLGTDIAGTAQIILPPGHAAYNLATAYRSEVTIYRQGSLLFRGRVLYQADDFYNRRTLTCEGERCFLRDSVMRPYLYQDSPAAVFEAVVGIHNAQQEAFKTFQVGTVTVTDPNNYIRLETESAETVADTIGKLVDRVGGYIVFTTNANGQRVINWLEDPGYHSNQSIEFGENLLDFSRSGAGTDLATVIVPYGSKNDETGERVTIESVNNGLDYIQDDDAVALRGTIVKAVYWDDVNTPSILLTKAQKYLANSKLTITTLTLSAVDLSVLDKNIDTFQVGDQVRVISKPHGVDDRFLLTTRSYDLIQPAQDRVTLGKDLTTLTGAGSAAQHEATNALNKAQQSIKQDYTLNTSQAVEQATQALSSLIQQTADSIQMMVSETYATKEGLESEISTRLTQLSDSFMFEFERIQASIDSNDVEAREQLEILRKYIRFEDGNIILGESGNELVLHIENDRISFLDSGAEVAYFSDKQLTVLDGHFLNSLRIGAFAFLPRENGNLSLVKVGD